MTEKYGTAEVLRVELAVVQEVQDSRHFRHIKLQDLVINDIVDI